MTSINASKLITTLTNHNSKVPVIALESTVIAGRTLQAYKRGKGDEARERFLEETTGAITWLYAVESLNKLGDKAIGKFLNKPNANFDVGTDKILRRPFDNFIKKANPKGVSASQVALIKGAKVITSVVLANLFIGFAVPKINHYITNLSHKKKQNKKIEESNNAINNNKLDINDSSKNSQNPSFKGGMAALNTFTNAIENTTPGKLLSTDIGIAGGRMFNARTNEERREIGIRDIGSIYFYMWSQSHVGQLMNLIESGKSSRLNPSTAQTVHEELKKIIESNNGEMDTSKFKEIVLGKQDVKLKENIPFEKAELSFWGKLTKETPLEVIKVSELEKYYTEPEILENIRKMSTLQPQRVDESVITKQQLIDTLKGGKITNPKLLNKVYTDFTQGASNDDFKFVSNKKLEKLKSEMIDYVENICKEANNNKINMQILDKAKKKNLIYNGINWAGGFGVSALFLSTLIPKLQYYVTRKTTGVNAFPGTYDYQNHKTVA